jgi:hypothetical protein
MGEGLTTDVMLPARRLLSVLSSGLEVIMIRRVLKAFICLLFVTNAAAQTPPSIEGVWRIAQRITPAGNPAANGVDVTQNNPAPSLLIFTKSHYSEIYETGGRPRPSVSPPANPQQLTDADKIAWYNQWRPFTANSGTYEISDRRSSNIRWSPRTWT